MNPRRIAMEAAVQLKRLAAGQIEQTRYTKYLQKMENGSEDEINGRRAVLLSELLNYAVENAPFYKQYKNELALEPDTVLFDIKHFPVITKDTVNENPDLFICKQGPPGKRFQTGGTSGERMVLIRDRNEANHTANEYFNQMVGVYPGITRLLIKSAESIYFADNPHDVVSIKNPLSGTYLVSPSYMDRERLELLYSIYKKKKPKLIIGITETIYRFARYIIENNLKSYPPRSILLGGQTVMPKHIKTIEKAFKTDRIFDRYGSTEFGILGHQCEKRDAYHYIPLIHYIETVDEQNNDVGYGQTGQLLITNLHKRAMPLIRYKVGDLARTTDKKCECGRVYPLIEKFEGRSIETVVSPNQTYMTPLPFYEIMDKVSDVKDFMVEQTKESTINIKLVTKNGPLDIVGMMSIRKDINRYLDYPMKVEYEYVDEIETLPNGKAIRVKGYENYNINRKGNNHVKNDT